MAWEETTCTIHFQTLMKVVMVSRLLRTGLEKTANFFTARLEWTESPEAYFFRAYLPELKEDEINVSLEDGKVLISKDKWREEYRERRKTW